MQRVVFRVLDYKKSLPLARKNFIIVIWYILEEIYSKVLESRENII